MITVTVTPDETRILSHQDRHPANTQEAHDSYCDEDWQQAIVNQWERAAEEGQAIRFTSAFVQRFRMT